MKKILAWDDRPEDYFLAIKKHFAAANISMEITEKAEDFRAKLRSDHWDFVITDIVDENRGEEVFTGKELAREAAATHPVFVLTDLLETERIEELELPRSVVVKTKRTPPAFTAREITQDLRRRGLLPFADRVFIIRGNSEGAGDLSLQLRTFLLNDCRLRADFVSGGDDLEDGDLARVRSTMNSSAAIIAICTKEDVSLSGQGRPDELTLLQIGMGAGVPNGLERMIVLQEWSDDDDSKCALLPKNLVNVKRLHFKTAITDVKTELIEALNALHFEVLQPNE